jgi:hypothetical protein
METNNPPATVIGNADELRELRDALAVANDAETPEPFAAHITRRTLDALALLYEQLREDYIRTNDARWASAPVYVAGRECECDILLLTQLIGTISDAVELLHDFIEDCPEPRNFEHVRDVQLSATVIARNLLDFAAKL